MGTLGIIIAFYALFGCLWWVVAKVTGKSYIVFLYKLFGISGCVISIIYILKYFNLI